MKSDGWKRMRADRSQGVQCWLSGDESEDRAVRAVATTTSTVSSRSVRCGLHCSDCLRSEGSSNGPHRTAGRLIERPRCRRMAH